MSGAEMLDIEECVTRLSVCFGKLEYLISVMCQKLEKNTDALTGQEREFYIYDRDNMRIKLDIAWDYINEASGIIRELRESLQDG